MKKTIIAAMLAIATFVSFSAQAQTADGNTVKTEQCQKKECKKVKKECKKDKKECKKGKKGKKGEKGCMGFKGEKGGKKGFGPKAQMDKKMLFKGVNLTEQQRLSLKEARKQVKAQEKAMMDSKVKDILTPDQFATYQQNAQQLDSIKAVKEQKKAEMKARRAEIKARKAPKDVK